MAFDNPLFRGGLSRTFKKIRLTDPDTQLEFGAGGTLSWTPTAARTITLPDASGELVTTGNLADVPLATATAVGVVKVPTSGHLAVDGSGNITAGSDIPLKDDNNIFSCGAITNSSLEVDAFQINPTIAQSGTASYVALSVDVTETSLGSGPKKLLNLATVGAGNVFYVDNVGKITAAASSSAASGEAVFLSMTPTVTQSATAGFTVLKINLTNVSNGSGNANLMDLQVGRATKFYVTSSGDVAPSGVLQMTKAIRTGVVTPTYAATISLNPDNGNTFIISTVHATSSTCTLNLSASPSAGEMLWVICTANNNADVITFGTHFLSTGTVTPTNGKFIVVEFVSDGTNAIEVSRSASAM